MQRAIVKAALCLAAVPLVLFADEATPAPEAGRVAVAAGWAIAAAERVAAIVVDNLHVASAAAAGITLCIFVAVFAFKRRTKKDERRFMTTTRLSLMDGEVQRACLYIEKHFTDGALTPASVCAAIVTGVPFLETMFERELGMSVTAYIDQVRIHHARQIARWNQGADASFVAAHVGFATPAEFEAHFERSTGTDFETFRRQAHTNGSNPR